MDEEYRVEKDLNKIEPSEWNEFLNSHVESCFFHTLEYFRAITKCKKINAILIAVIINDKIVGVALGEIGDEIFYLPYLTRRTIFYAKPLYSNNNVLAIILKEITKHGKGLFCQIRPFFTFNEAEINLLDSFSFKQNDHLNAFININSSLSEIYEKFDKDKQKGINKAIKKFNLKIEEHTDSKIAVEKFYCLQKLLFKGKKTFLKPQEYFYNLLTESDRYVKIYFAYYNNILIASQLILISQNRLIAFYTATHPEHKNKHAGDLLIWKLIEFSKKNEINIFDFGGAGRPNENYPPRDYKRRFGAEFINVGRFTLFRLKIFRLLFN